MGSTDSKNGPFLKWRKVWPRLESRGHPLTTESMVTVRAGRGTKSAITADSRIGRTPLLMPQLSPRFASTAIGIWGTSLGGRDVLVLGAIDRRVKAVLSQTPLIKWLPATGARIGGFGDDLDVFFKAIAEDRKARMMGRGSRYVPFVKPSGDEPKAAYINSMGEADLRNYSGHLTLQSYQPTALIDVTPFVPLIAPTPVRFILAAKDFLPGRSEAYQAAEEPRSLVDIVGDHFAPYTTSKKESIQATKEFFLVFVQHLMSK